jgi:hypothetical protein
LQAAKRGDEGVVKLLLDTGRVKIDSKDKYGRTLAVVGSRGTVQSHRQATVRYGQGRGRLGGHRVYSPKARTKV